MQHSLLEPDIEKRIDDIVNLLREVSQSKSLCSGISDGRPDEEIFLVGPPSLIQDFDEHESNDDLKSKDNETSDLVNNVEIGDDKSLNIKRLAEVPIAKTFNIRLLPENVMLNIFKFLDDRDIRSNIQLVCKKWNKICEDLSIYNRLRFCERDQDSISVCRSLQNASQLQELKLYKLNNICTIIRQLCRTNTDIKLLHVKHCVPDKNVEKVPEAVFVNIILCCPKLENFSLKGTPFRARTFYQKLPCLQKMKTFGLGANPFLRSTDILTVAYNCRTLLEFNLSRRPHTLTLTDQDIDFIFSKKNMASRIKSLKFDAIGLTPLQFQNILNCSNLEQITLNNCVSITGQVFQKITKRMPLLKKMIIRQGYELKPFDFVEVFKFNNLTKLTHLDFYGCWRLNNSALSAIVGCTFPNLEHFSISSCSEVTSVLEIFKCTQLRYLNVSYIGKVDNESIKQLGLTLPLLQVFIIDANEDYLKILQEIKKKRSSLKLLQSTSQYNPKKLIKI